MDILIIGLNHKSAGISDRESVSKKLVKPESRAEFYNFLKNLKGESGKLLVSEAVVVTTCNRSEFIFSLSKRDRSAGHALKNSISEYFFSKKRDDIIYMYANKEAVDHLFKVASSLDSMIIGEPQILGQIKDAYNESCQLKMAGPVLNKLFHKAFYCAKKVRTETRIASSPVSVSYAAVELSKKIFNNLGEKKILLLGTGEMGRLTVRHFIKLGLKNIFISNRTKEKAYSFVEEEFELNEKDYLNVVDFSEYYKLLPSMDIILCSTGSESYVLKYDDIMPIIKLRKQKPLFLIDISVPRNIDPEINKISNIYLFDIDDIGKMIEDNMEVRKKEADKAGEIVTALAGDFLSWKDSLNAVPVIVSLRKKVKDILEAELSKYITVEKEKDIVVNSITNKILHEPVTIIKKSSGDSGGQVILETMKTLFNLDLENSEGTGGDYIGNPGDSDKGSRELFKEGHSEEKRNDNAGNEMLTRIKLIK